MVGAFGWIMAAGLISRLKETGVDGIGTMIGTTIGTVMGIEATTIGLARDRSSLAHRMTCTGTTAQLTPAAAWS
ncbi:MAG TPA: hypothetical protein VK579_03310 [Terriglobales bacterium]|nr:hypothetical protein [Terriglobales bacterium]